MAVQCKRYSDRQYVSSADMQKFAGAARTVEPADIALYVATCTFTHEAQAIARLSGIVLVDRYELEAWTSGVRLRTLRQAHGTEARSRKSKLRLRALTMLLSPAPSAASARCPPSAPAPVRPTRCTGTPRCRRGCTSSG
ncbi:restriction endonuclease [Streptomyces sp. NPDC093984]|uniref:restriction endonuclease n=1 Tax=Streptomyces sp. NPDC093984 TaxID=3366052 RepID=UPI00381E31AB